MEYVGLDIGKAGHSVGLIEKSLNQSGRETGGASRTMTRNESNLGLKRGERSDSTYQPTHWGFGA